MHGVLQASPLARVEEDEANLLAALLWARRDDLGLALRLGAALAPFWEFGGRVNEGRAWLDDLLAAPGSAPPGDGLGGRERAGVRIRLLRGAARLAWRQKDMDRARQLLEECLELARRVGDPGGEAAALCTLGIVAFSDGDPDRALVHGGRSLAVARAAGNDVVAIWARLTLGWAHHMRGEKADGDRMLQEMLACNRPYGSPSVRAQAHSALQFGAFLAGDVAAQREHLVEVLAAMEDGGAVEPSDWLGLAIGLARSEGRARSAALLTGGARAFGQRRGSVTPDTVVAPYLAHQTDGALVDRQEAEGERMTWEQLVTEALREPAHPTSHPLTRREAEVAGLVAEGLNNVAIAARLHISRRTVETHVEHIKRKLAVTHRHQILTWALTELPPRP
jgi:DNA-binding CsgD family transcriptional regulator